MKGRGKTTAYSWAGANRERERGKESSGDVVTTWRVPQAFLGCWAGGSGEEEGMVGCPIWAEGGDADCLAELGGGGPKVRKEVGEKR